MTKIEKWECEARLLFAIVVAGKSEKFARKVIAKFLVDMCDTPGDTPLQYVKRLHEQGVLEARLREVKSGSYGRISKAFAGVVDMDVYACTIQQLEAIHGIGPKTSRFFIMWTRPDSRHAALDRHILRWLAYLGYDVPKNTPTGDKYLVIEKQFISEADERGKTPRDLDAEIWEHYSQGGNDNSLPKSLRP